MSFIINPFVFSTAPAAPISVIDVVNQGGSASTAQVITMPSGIQAGDLLVAFSVATNTGGLSSSAGWNHTTYSNWAPGGDDACITWREAVGSDTLTITSSISAFKSTTTFLIRNADTSSINQTIGAYDPPSINMPVNPSNGVVLVVLGQQTQSGRCTGPSSGYTTGLIPDAYNKGGSQYKIVSNAASENPGTFAGSAATSNVSLVVAISEAS